MIESAPLPVGPRLEGFAAAIDRRQVEQLLANHLAHDCRVRILRPGYLRYKGEDGALVGWWVSLSSQSAPSFVTLRVAPPGRLAIEAERAKSRRQLFISSVNGVLEKAKARRSKDGKSALDAFVLNTAESILKFEDIEADSGMIKLFHYLLLFLFR